MFSYQGDEGQDEDPAEDTACTECGFNPEHAEAEDTNYTFECAGCGSRICQDCAACDGRCDWCDVEGEDE